MRSSLNLTILATLLGSDCRASVFWRFTNEILVHWSDPKHTLKDRLVRVVLKGGTHHS